MWGTRSVGGTHGPVGGIYRQDVPTGSQADFLVESSMQLVVLHPLEGIPEGPGSCSPATSCHPQSRLCNTSQYTGLGKKGVYVFGSILHSLGSQMLIHILTCLCGRSHGPRRSLLALSCATLREGWHRQKETTPLTLFIMSNNGFFPPMAWNAISLLDYWTSTKALLPLGDCQNQCSLVVR